MKEFLGDATAASQQIEAASSDSVRQMIESCLTKASHDTFQLRLAEEQDLQSIGRLVQGLADFEKEPDAVHVTLDHYRIDGFPTNTENNKNNNPLFYCLLLESVSDDDKMTYVCGMAFCYLGKTLEKDRHWYLEDLFIEGEYRGMGAGTFIMKTLASIGLALDCSHLRWQALDWNIPALTFYNKLGASVIDGLLTTRFAGDDLKQFAGVHK